MSAPGARRLNLQRLEQSKNFLFRILIHRVTFPQNQYRMAQREPANHSKALVSKDMLCHFMSLDHFKDWCIWIA